MCGIEAPSVADIYVQLHRMVKDSFLTTGRRDLPERTCTTIVALLEPALFMQQQPEQAKDFYTTLNKFHQLLDKLDDEEAHRLMDEIMETPLDSDIEDEMDEAPDVEDPLDQVVHSILTKHVESPTARRQFADMIAPRKPPVPQTIEIKGRSRTSDSWKGDGASSPGEDDEAVGAAATFIVKAPPPAPRRHPARSCSAARSLPLS